MRPPLEKQPFQNACQGRIEKYQFIVACGDFETFDFNQMIVQKCNG
jgi:hypothetical protein